MEGVALRSDDGYGGGVGKRFESAPSRDENGAFADHAPARWQLRRSMAPPGALTFDDKRPLIAAAMVVAELRFPRSFGQLFLEACIFEFPTAEGTSARFDKLAGISCSL